MGVGLADRLWRRRGAWRRSGSGGRPKHTEMSRFPVFSIVNGLTQFYAGSSSFIYHASSALSKGGDVLCVPLPLSSHYFLGLNFGFISPLTKFPSHTPVTSVGQVLDMAGVYGLVTTPAFYALLRLGCLGPPSSTLAQSLFVGLVTLAAFACYNYKWRVSIVYEKWLPSRAVAPLTGHTPPHRAMESAVGGSTNLVLACICVLVFLLCLWALVLGSPGAPHPHPHNPRPSPLPAVARPSTVRLRGAWARAKHSVASLFAAAGLSSRAAPLWQRMDSHASDDASAGFDAFDDAAAAGGARGGGGGSGGGGIGGSGGGNDPSIAASISLTLSAAAAHHGAAPAPAPGRLAAAYLPQRLRWLAARRRRPRGLRYRWAGACLVAIGCAYGAREGDVQGHFACFPDGWFQCALPNPPPSPILFDGFFIDRDSFQTALAGCTRCGTCSQQPRCTYCGSSCAPNCRNRRTTTTATAGAPAAAGAATTVTATARLTRVRVAQHTFKELSRNVLWRCFLPTLRRTRHSCLTRALSAAVLPSRRATERLSRASRGERLTPSPRPAHGLSPPRAVPLLTSPPHPLRRAGSLVGGTLHEGTLSIGSALLHASGAHSHALAHTHAAARDGGGGGGGVEMGALFGGGGREEEAHALGVPPGTARAAAHLRTRSREVFSLPADAV